MISLSSPGWYRLSAALWLSTEVQALLTSGRLTALFRDELSPAPLSADLEQLVGVVCRLPDTLSNRLGRQLSPSLLPPQYFKMVGLSIADCLKDVAATSKCKYNHFCTVKKFINVYLLLQVKV